MISKKDVKDRVAELKKEGNVGRGLASKLEIWRTENAVENMSREALLLLNREIAAALLVAYTPKAVASAFPVYSNFCAA